VPDFKLSADQVAVLARILEIDRPPTIAKLKSELESIGAYYPVWLQQDEKGPSWAEQNAALKKLLASPEPKLTLARLDYATQSRVVGALLVVWPGVVQTLFRDPDFVGHEGGLIRVIGLTVVVIGWLYLFGGRSGARQVVAASVIDRLVFIPIVLLPLAITGVFPHLLMTFAVLDPSLAIGAWALLGRE
jgi:hypothetical protein